MDGANTLICVCFTLFGCFFNALSLIMMKVALEKAQREGRDKIPNPYLLKEWIIGLGALIIGTLANVFAIGYGNLLLLASSSAVTIIFSTVLSVKILKETFSKYDVIAIAFIMVGSGLCVSFSKNDSTPLTGDDLLNLYV